MLTVLVCQIDPEISSELKQAMEEYGWIIHSCEGLLEMLRLIEKNDYDVVLLNANHRSVEVSTRLEAIKALGKDPRIFLNLPNSAEILPSLLLITNYPMIKGVLTIEKLLAALQETS